MNATSYSSSQHMSRVDGKAWWLLVAGGIVAVYLLIHLALPRLITGSLAIYLVQPLFWCGLIAVILAASKYGEASKLVFTRSRLKLAIALGAMQLVALFIAGLLSGFGRSPYSHAPFDILQNLFYWGSALVGIELARAYLIGPFKTRHTVTMLLMISLTFTALMIPLSRYSSLQQPIPFLGETCLPLFAENLLASFLVLLGGPIAAIAYRGMLLSFEWWSPIMADLPWIMKAFVGTLAPVIGLLIAQTFYDEADSEQAKVDASRRVKNDQGTRALMAKLQQYERLQERLQTVEDDLGSAVLRDSQRAAALALKGADPPRWWLKQMSHEKSHYESLLRQKAMLTVKIAAMRETVAYGSESQIERQAQGKAGTKKNSGPLFLAALAIVAVAMVFFVTGALGFRPLLVSSTSMHPAMNVGDIVIVNHASAESIKVGDVVQYRDGGVDTIHRVIETQGQGGAKVFITQGDASSTPDINPVRPQQIVGKVQLRIPKLGWVSIWGKSLFS